MGRDDKLFKDKVKVHHSEQMNEKTRHNLRGKIWIVADIPIED